MCVCVCVCARAVHVYMLVCACPTVNYHAKKEDLLGNLSGGFEQFAGLAVGSSLVVVGPKMNACSHLHIITRCDHGHRPGPGHRGV